jgi:hypothetical protein
MNVCLGEFSNYVFLRISRQEAASCSDMGRHHALLHLVRRASPAIASMTLFCSIRVHLLMPSLRFGYNNAVAGGLLNLPSWIAVFPEIDTANTKGSVKDRNSKIQVLQALETQTWLRILQLTMN